MSAAPFSARAEADRLRKTLALAEEALRLAADHRSARHAPGETAAETAERWAEAAEIETAALDCRKAARAALTRITGVVITAPEDHLARIETARAAALDLKAACERGQHGHAARTERLGPVRRNWRKIPKGGSR
jgi:hypothetical protein